MDINSNNRISASKSFNETNNSYKNNSVNLENNVKDTLVKNSNPSINKTVNIDPKRFKTIDKLSSLAKIIPRAIITGSFTGIVSILSYLLNSSDQFKLSATQPAVACESKPVIENKINKNSFLYDKAKNFIMKVLDKYHASKITTIDKRFDTNEIKKLLKPGDILLTSQNNYPGWQFVEKVLFDSDWTHAAIYIGDGRFVESTTDDKQYYVPLGNNKFRVADKNDLKDLNKLIPGFGIVEELPVEKCFNNCTHLAVVRPPYKTREDINSAINYAKNQVGKLYDDDMNTNDDSKLFCSELPFNALKSGPNPINYKIEPLSGIISPDVFLNKDNSNLIWSDGSNFWKNMLSHI